MIEFFRRKAKAALGRPDSQHAIPDVRPIPAATLRFHPSSYADPSGRVFVYEGRLYRGIPAERVAFCEMLFNRGVVADLVEKGFLPATKRSGPAVEGFAAVLEHERITFSSYPNEWSAEMLRDAALLTLDLLQELSVHGLTLKDAHGWNVLFRGPRPVFVDFGSIVESAGEGGWLPHVEQEFREYFLYPLLLMAVGQGRMARALLCEFDRGLRAEECRAVVTAAGHAFPDETPGQSFTWHRACIDAVRLQADSKGWSGYYDGEFPDLHPGPGWHPKHHAVHGLLQQFRPATVLDIGANRGWYAMLAATLGAQVAAFDNDETCVSYLYSDARKRQLPVTPLLMSLLNPTPRLGLGYGVTEPASERLRADLVLGLAVVHHMVFKMHLNFDQIAAGLAAYVGRTLVVEFVPSDDIHVSQWMTPRYQWYTLAGFKASLDKHFRVIRTVASHPSPRILLVCER